MKKLLVLSAALIFLSAGSAYAKSVTLYFNGFAKCSPGFSKLNFSALKMRISKLDNIKDYSHGSPILRKISGKVSDFSRIGTLNHTLQMLGLMRTYGYYSPNPGIGFKSKTGKVIRVVWLSVASGPGGTVKNLPSAYWIGSMHLRMGSKKCVLRFNTK